MFTFRLPEIALSLSCELDCRLDAVCVFGKVATFFIMAQKLSPSFWLPEL